MHLLKIFRKLKLNSGGRFMRQAEIKNMTVNDLFMLLVPNNVIFDIQHKSPKTYK